MPTQDTFSEEQRTAALIAGEAEMECRVCRWLGTEDAATVMTGTGPTDFTYRCPNYGASALRDYESTLYKADYR